MTYRKAMQLGEELLAEKGIADAKNDAWLLLAMACEIDHTYYYMHMEQEIPQEQFEQYENIIRKRMEHIPLQYITGEQFFMGMRFKVNENVLIPRQDTETLVSEALRRINPGMKVLDVCTGSGCVLISILKNSNKVEGVGVDISKQAINIAKENAKSNDVIAEFEKSDLFDSVLGTFDMIVSNPPYIPTDVIPTLMPEVAQFEPYIALDGKEDGLYFYKQILAQAKDYLNPNGMLLFEIGHDQGAAVSKLMEQAGFEEVTVIQDLARNDRVVFGKL